MLGWKVGGGDAGLLSYLLKIPDAGPPEKSRGLHLPTPALLTKKRTHFRKFFANCGTRKIHSPFWDPSILPPTFKLPQGWRGVKSSGTHGETGENCWGTFSNFRADGKCSYRVKCFCKSTWKWMQSVRQKKGCWWYKSFRKIVLKFSGGISMRWAYSFVYLYVYWWQREITTSLNHKGVSRFGNVRFDFSRLKCNIELFSLHHYLKARILISCESVTYEYTYQYTDPFIYIHLVYIYIFLCLYSCSFTFKKFNRCLSIYVL